MQGKYFIVAVWCFAISCFLWLPAAYARTEGKPLTITNISLDKKTFPFGKESRVKIRYQLSKDAFVSVSIYNENDVWVRTLLRDGKMAAGSHFAEWDGKNDTGEPLPSGVYVYTIEAVCIDRESASYDPTDETGGILLEVRKPLLDTEKGEISYLMPKAGMVRIRAGIHEGPHLRTLVDWKPREAGRNIEKWDGKDSSGLIDLFNIPKREVFVFAYSLPDNCIILNNPSASPSMKETGERSEYRPRKRIDPKSKYKHALENKSVRREPEFQVTFPKAASRTSEGIPIVSGVVPVKITISEKDRHRLESARFEVMFFVDTMFIFEDEEGFTPFTYMWNTQGLSVGEHIFTVNIMSYNDHCGVESRKVIIKP